MDPGFGLTVYCVAISVAIATSTTSPWGGYAPSTCFQYTFGCASQCSLRNPTTCRRVFCAVRFSARILQQATLRFGVYRFKSLGRGSWLMV